MNESKYSFYIVIGCLVIKVGNKIVTDIHFDKEYTQLVNTLIKQGHSLQKSKSIARNIVNKDIDLYKKYRTAHSINLSSLSK